MYNLIIASCVPGKLLNHRGMFLDEVFFLKKKTNPQFTPGMEKLRALADNRDDRR